MLLFPSTPAWLTPVDHSLSAGTREVTQPVPACRDIPESHPTADRSVFSTVSVPATWPVPERSAVTRVPGPVDLQPSVRPSTTVPCAAVSRDISETPTLETVRTPTSAGLTETVETVWPVLRMTAATGSVSTPVTEPSVGPTLSVRSSTKRLSVGVWTNIRAILTTPGAAPRWMFRVRSQLFMVK